MELIYENERIYSVDDSGKVIAEITFPKNDKDPSQRTAVIDHTFVDESLRGQGAAGKLVKAAADKLTQEGYKISVTCSYAARWFEKHTEYNVSVDDEHIACSIKGKH